MNQTTSGIGALGEEIARNYLVRKGYRIIESNFRKPWGEIDIIAEKERVVRFVEVKAISGRWDNISRESSELMPEEQIHSAKLRKIARTAELYMAEKGDGREYQIDAVGVLMDMKLRKAKCRLFEQIL
ncbi:YraN family protein [bacterium]|nr:YraN family protein [bacterium]